jgi:MOSC domain-containing protein YiiM
VFSREAIEELRRKGAEVSPGDFAENLTVEGLNSSFWQLATVSESEMKQNWR